MATEKKPETARSGRLVRCPAHVHDLMEELRALMAEQGHQAYWVESQGKDTKIVHGSIADAPKYLVIQWALTTGIEILHPARAQFAAAHEAREDYLESFKEGPEESEQ